MKTILILLFPIVLIGCRNRLSDKEVDAILDKAAKPPSQDIVCIGCDSIQYAALVNMVHRKPQSEVLASFGEELKAYSKQLEILSKHQDELAESFNRINKELDKLLLEQNRKINPPNKNYSGIVLPGMVYSIIDMPITTGGSSVAIGPAALGKGVTGMSVDHLTGGSRNTPLGPNALMRTYPTDSIITIGYPNICIGDSSRYKIIHKFSSTGQAHYQY